MTRSRVSVSWVVLSGVLAASPVAAQVVRVSVATAGTQANGPSDSPSISGDGRYVVFASAADNLVAGDTNVLPDIFLRDRDTDADGIFDEAGAVATTRLNVGPGGAQANNASYAPKITPDGRYVCFISKATNLTATPVPAEVLQAFRLDRQTGTIVVVSANDEGAAGNSHTREAAISDSGDVVAFSSEAGNLVGGAQTSTIAMFVREIGAGHTTRLSPPGPASDFYYTNPVVSPDGRRVAYFFSWRVRTLIGSIIHDRATGTERRGPVSFSAMLTFTADSEHVIGATGSETFRAAVALPDHAVLSLPKPTSSAIAGSRDGRYVLLDDGTATGAALGNFDRRTIAAFGLRPLRAAFDATGRYVAVETTTDLAQVGDTNGLSDIVVVDLPAYLDADHDGLDDPWETLFGVTDPAADPDGDGLTNAQEYVAGSHPNGVVHRYFAEGATGTFFETTITLANPDASATATAVLTFDKSDGTRVRQTVPLPPHISAVVEVGAIPGLGSADVATTIDSDRPLGIDRTMRWDTSPTTDASRGYGSHKETATPAPSTTWFLAEGSTVLEFNLFYLLYNPQATATHTTVRFLLPSGSTVTRAYDLPARSRTTIYVNDVPGLDETDVSGDISADAPIIVERAMYRNLPGQPFGLGTESMGVTAPATRWFLAEGATGSFFDLYVLIANPGNADAQVEAQYAKPDGSVVTRTYTVGAHSRFSVFVDAIGGLESTPVATTITSTNAVPVVVERAMYWPGGFFDYYEGHSSAGSTTTARRWVVTSTLVGQSFILIANTENRAGTATITLLPNYVQTVPFDPIVVTLPPNSRTTVPLSIPTVGVLVESTGTSPVELVVEGSDYQSVGEVTWSAGSNALGTPLP